MGAYGVQHNLFGSCVTDGDGWGADLTQVTLENVLIFASGSSYMPARGFRVIYVNVDGKKVCF